MSGIPVVDPRDAQVWTGYFGMNDNEADNALSTLGLQLTAIANAPTLVTQTAGKYGSRLRVTTDSTADGDGWVIHSFPDGLVLTPGMIFRARVAYPVELASMNFRIGLQDSVTAARPTVGATIESDAGVLTCNADSADGTDQAAAVAGHPDLTSGTTMVVGTDYDFEIRLSGENSLGGPKTVEYLAGAAGSPLKRLGLIDNFDVDDDEEVELSFVGWQDSGGADAVAFEIVHFQLIVPVLN